MYQKPKPGHQSPDIGPAGRPCDDEEDCYIGSGSGEFNTDDNDSSDDKGIVIVTLSYFTLSCLVSINEVPHIGYSYIRID